MWREMKEGEPFSPLGSLEAAAMKLSAAVCNLFTYSVSDGWRGGAGREEEDRNIWLKTSQ